MRTFNVAILGQGRSGYSIHGAYYQREREKYRVVAVVDALPERREKAARIFGCDTYADYRALLSRGDIDLVVNSFFSPAHYDVTRELLAAGKNVLVEKPGSHDPEQIDDLERTAKASGATLAFFQQSRFAPYFVKIKEVLASGVLGRIVQISVAFDGYARRWDWQTLQKYGAGSLYNTGPHPLDQALNLLGGTEIPQILCKMDRVNTFGDAEDYVKLIMTLPDKPLVDLSISSCNAYPSGTYNIQGSHGGLYSDQKCVRWRWFDPKEAPSQHLITTPLTTPEGEPAYCTEALPWRQAEWVAAEHENSFTSAVDCLYDNLYRHLCFGEALVVTTAQVRRQIEVIRRCHEQNPLSHME